MCCFLRPLLSKYLYGFLLKEKTLCAYVSAGSMPQALTFLKGNTLSGLDSLLDIAVVDNVSLFKDSKRFVLNYVFWNYSTQFRFVLKVMVNILQPVYSITNFYASSEWLEREVWDMFGIKFLFHPNLRRILTDYGFNGHPFRKDFPLVGYLEIFYDDSKQVVGIHPVEVSQAMRFYQLNNPWNNWYY
jgi:NADH dehydrogenase (ubiquinone) Fe-S protein 3